VVCASLRIALLYHKTSYACISKLAVLLLPSHVLKVHACSDIVVHLQVFCLLCIATAERKQDRWNQIGLQLLDQEALSIADRVKHGLDAAKLSDAERVRCVDLQHAMQGNVMGLIPVLCVCVCLCLCLSA